MPCYSVKEFGDLTGIEPKNIHTYVGRRKLVKNKKGLIDTTEALNSVFLESRKIDVDVKSAKPKKKEKKKPEPKEINPPEPKEVTEEQKRLDFQIPTSTDLLIVDYEKKLKEVQKLKKEIAIKDEDLKKKRKEVIDTESTIALVKAFSDSLKKELVSRIQTHIQDICTRYAIDPAKTAKYKTNVVEIVNKSNDISRDMLLKHFVDG